MKFHILCGIPGSGKSTLAKQIPGYTISTDNIRNFLWKDPAIIKHDKLVFQVAEDIMEYMLSLKKDIIFDATNLKKERRKKYITLAKKYKSIVILHWIKCPPEIAIRRNLNRKRKVPVSAIKGLMKSLQRPDISEGMDCIKIYNKNLELIKIILG